MNNTVSLRKIINEHNSPSSSIDNNNYCSFSQLHHYIHSPSTIVYSNNAKSQSKHNAPKLSHSLRPNYNNNCSIFDYDFVKTREENAKAKTKLKLKGIKARKGLKRSMRYNTIATSNSSYSIYQKEMEAQIKLNDKLNEMRIDKQIKELSLLKSKPDIDSHSIELISHSSKKNYKPIHKRVNSIIKEHQTKLNTIKLTIEKDSAKDNKGTLNPSALIKAKEPSLNSKQQKANFIKWIEEIEIWEQTRKAKLTYLKQDIANREVEDNETYFHPKINPKSSLIAQYKIHNQSPNMRLPLNAKKRMLIPKKKGLTPSFPPFNNHEYKIRNHYSFSMEENQKDISDSN